MTDTTETTDLAKPLPTPEQLLNHRAARKMLQRGDADGALAAYAGELDLDLDALDTPTRTLLRTTTRLALELRRMNVSVIGNSEAFLRHGRDGSLLQVVRPVQLSIHDGSLYQFSKNRKQGDRWVSTVVGDPNKAFLTAQGYQAINAVAGCAVGSPPTVVVDGKEVSNPYVEYAKRHDGRRGEVVRVVVKRIVAGPAPATGNPIAMAYTLEVDTTQDLATMLGNLAKGSYNSPGSEDVKLWPERLAAEDKWPRDNGAWQYLHVGNGVGYAYDVTSPEVLKKYVQYGEMLSQAVKRAQTIASRNAMRAHPAFGKYAGVRINDDGEAVIGVVGWAGDQAAMARWQRLQLHIAEGADLHQVEDDLVVEEVHETLEPEDMAEVVVDDATDDATELRQLIAYVDDHLDDLDHVQVVELEWTPGQMDREAIIDAAAKVRAIVEGS